MSIFDAQYVAPNHWYALIAGCYIALPTLTCRPCCGCHCCPTSALLPLPLLVLPLQLLLTLPPP